MEVYATKFNLVYHLNKIINRQLDPHVDDYLIENLIFNKKKNKYLQDYVIAQCYYLVEFLHDPNAFINKHGKVWVDEKKYYEVVQPCYHTSDQCIRINMDFINVEIPERVRKNDEIVKKIRSAPVKILNPLFTKEIVEQLCKEINFEYSIEPPLTDKDFKHLEFDTGPNMKLETDIEKLISKTEELHDSAIEFLEKNPHILSYRSSNYSPPSYEDFLKYYSTDHYAQSYIYSCIFDDLYYFKKYILNPIQLRIKYYAVGIFNKEIKFEKTLLDALGFRPCRSC